jgi:hypothetical protein
MPENAETPFDPFLKPAKPEFSARSAEMGGKIAK